MSLVALSGPNKRGYKTLHIGNMGSRHLVALVHALERGHIRSDTVGAKVVITTEGLPRADALGLIVGQLCQAQIVVLEKTIEIKAAGGKTVERKQCVVLADSSNMLTGMIVSNPNR